MQQEDLLFSLPQLSFQGMELSGWLLVVCLVVTLSIPILLVSLWIPNLSKKWKSFQERSELRQSVRSYIAMLTNYYRAKEALFVLHDNLQMQDMPRNFHDEIRRQNGHCDDLLKELRNLLDEISDLPDDSKEELRALDVKVQAADEVLKKLAEHMNFFTVLPEKIQEYHKTASQEE